jgi:hypothetical protein
MAKGQRAIEDRMDVAAILPWWLGALHLKRVIDNAKGMPAFTIANEVNGDKANGLMVEFS